MVGGSTQVKSLPRPTVSVVASKVRHGRGGVPAITRRRQIRALRSWRTACIRLVFVRYTIGIHYEESCARVSIPVGRLGVTFPMIDRLQPPARIMYTYPWDLVDHGVDRSLADLRRVGVSAVQLAFSYHVASFLTPGNPRSRIERPRFGGLHFHPTTVSDVDWPFEPPVSPLVEHVGSLDALTSDIARQGMSTVAWVVYLYNHALATSRSDLAVVNAFGDRNAAQLCPSNPDVRAYAEALTDSVLAHDGLSGIVCESLAFLPFDYGLLNLKAAVRPGARTRYLLGLCFCTFCRSRFADAGLDVDRFAADVRAVIDESLAELPDVIDDAPVHEEWVEKALDERLGVAHRVRVEIATTLHERVLDKARIGGVRAGSTANEGACEFVSAIDERRLSRARDELRVELLPSMTSSAVANLLADAEHRAGHDDSGRPKPVYGLVQLSNFVNEHAFLSTLENAFTAGFQNLRYYEFGLLTRRQWAWLGNVRSLEERHRDSARGMAERSQ